MVETIRTVRLLDPTAKPHENIQPLARRHADLRGKRIGILDNAKTNADVLMLRMAELLCQINPFQRAYAYILQEGMDVVNSNLTNFKILEENLKAVIV